MNEFDFSGVVTTGATGMVGSYVDFGVRVGREDLNILDQTAVLDFISKHRPHTIIHLASATDTTRCEEDPKYAFSVNAMGTFNVALAAVSVGAVMVYVSTSRVFDGQKETPYTEQDTPNPTTVYGKSKYLGELIVSLMPHEYLIVRGCWMFGGGPNRDNKFYGNVMKQLENQEIAALDDVYGSPTYAKDFIRGIKELLVKGNRGTFHVGNAGMATRADIVQYMVDLKGSTVQVKNVNQDYFKMKYGLPKNESMHSRYVVCRPWKDALKEYIQAEWGDN